MSSALPLSLQTVDLHFELLLQSDPVGLSCAPNLVRAANNTQFVVNHMGDPDIHDRQMSSWATAMAALSTLPNVVIKVKRWLGVFVPYVFTAHG